LGEKSFRPLWPILLGFIALLVAVGAAQLLASEESRADQQARRTVEIEKQLSQLRTLVTEAETGQRGFLLTGDRRYLAPFETAQKELGPAVDNLSSESADDGSEKASVESLREAISQKLDELRRTIDLRSAGHADEALAIVTSGRGSELMAAIHHRLTELEAEARKGFETRASEARRLNFLAQTTSIVCAALVVVLAALTLIDARRRQAKLLATNARLVKEAEEREAAEKQVRQLQKMEAIGQLAGGMAHDFNNMLAVVIGSLDIMRGRLSDSENPSLRKFLDAALEGANRAALLTNRVLAFSRRQPLEPVLLDVNRLVGEMSELLRRTLGETIHVETVLAGGLWNVNADPSQLESALLNLAVNARDAMPDGGKMTVETANAFLDERYAANETDLAAGQYVMISVTDTGAGMTKEVAERAFDPFYTTKAAGKGTGLGLSQIYGFVKQSSGHVKIYSESGQGTTVKIYLPRQVGDGADASARETVSPAGGTRDELILVVEDDDDVRKTTIELLRELGYGVVATKLPSEALQALQTRPEVALLFTDVVMPEMNGRQLAAKAREGRPRLKILYTSGYTRNAIVHNGVVDPDAALIAKPFTLEQLESKIAQCLCA